MSGIEGFERAQYRAAAGASFADTVPLKVHEQACAEAEDRIASLDRKLAEVSRRSAQWCASTARLSGQTFTHYAEQAKRTAAPWQDGPEGLAYFALGLCSEVGEVDKAAGALTDLVRRMSVSASNVADKTKKHFRACEGVANAEALTEAQREALKLELGDVLWYVSQIARVCDLSLQDVAEANIQKLAKRHKLDPERQGVGR